jgi:putative NADH-flavin reductase
VGTALNVGLLSRVSRVDLARFLLDEAAAGHHVRERVYVRG